MTVDYDTASLMRETGLGVEMAIYSFDELLERVRNPALKKVIKDAREDHKRLQNENNALMKAYELLPPAAGAMAKGMAWMETNWKMTMEDSDRVIANIITKGCDTGTRNLRRYVNEYAAADPAAADTAKKLIDVEEKLEERIRLYL